MIQNAGLVLQSASGAAEAQAGHTAVGGLVTEMPETTTGCGLSVTIKYGSPWREVDEVAPFPLLA